jgi:hypothetical protein
MRITKFLELDYSIVNGAERRLGEMEKYKEFVELNQIE